MGWSFVFGAANLLAMIAWVALIALPRWPALLSALLYLGIGLLCLVYSVAFIGLISGLIPNDGDPSWNFTTIEGVRAIFASDGGVTIGWIHYLAFDLFVGLWIARDADGKSISRLIQAPILLATLFAGPIGLTIWLLVREPAARRLGRFS